MSVKAAAKAAHPLDDPKTVRQVCDGLDRVLADLREVRVTLERSKKAKRGSS